jgi:hypothetical protein
MKTLWGVEVQLHAFLTSALDDDEWSASGHIRFTPQRKALPLTPRNKRPGGPKPVWTLQRSEKMPPKRGTKL